MTGLLDDLDEGEIRDLVESVRSIGPQYSSMTDSEVCMRILNCKVNMDGIARHCHRRKILLRLVTLYPNTLKYVPERLKDDYDLCMVAVMKRGWALTYVPEHLRDLEMCVEAVRGYGPTSARHWDVIERSNFHTKDLLDYGGALGFVPQGLVRSVFQLLRPGAGGWDYT